MKNRKSFWGGVLTGVLAVALVAGGIYLGYSAWMFFRYSRAQNVSVQENAEGVSANSVATQNTLNKLDVIEETIEKYYLEDVDEQTLEDGIYKGMVESLGDPYSTYYAPDELEQIQEKTEGIYYGIGAYIGIDTETSLPRLTGIIDGTPAQESGLRAGDLIYQVDGTDVQGLELEQVTSLVKGEEGTTVHLTIIREGESDYLEIDVVRRQVESPTVNQEMLDDRIGYIQITEFDTVTLDQFTEALAVCRGKGMEGLILDLRGNPGGNLSTVCEIARQILPEGLIVYTEDKNGKRTEYSCDGEHEMTEELVVLVDGNSASASEILAGAIKDYGIGTLVGTTTFGKGIVQRIISLTDGSAVKLTVSHYYTPNGNNIHEVGIEPDVEIAFDGDAYYNDDVDNQLQKAIEVMNEKLGAADGQEETAETAA
ncbi:MAG TPA: S41 family peptidase [Candidatus Eisenbergiella intestinigallinarum]|uniref:S41 family peptidase n=1 Tax=Candidatus Eisenbergiella intestinigallinarum TaxID=2838549 RepID=A0A9D2QMT4_9FIRM|nr:S41 family peptidase [Candidatus Eisenbergiella intestinigallinarum]